MVMPLPNSDIPGMLADNARKLTLFVSVEEKTVDAVPVVQRFAVGTLVKLPLFEDPHTPLMAEGELTPEVGVSVT